MLHVDDGGGTREGAPGGPSAPFLMVGGGGGTGGGQLPPYSLPISATVSLKAEQKCAQSVSAAQKIHFKAKKLLGRIGLNLIRPTSQSSSVIEYAQSQSG